MMKLKNLLTQSLILGAFAITNISLNATNFPTDSYCDSEKCNDCDEYGNEYSYSVPVGSLCTTDGSFAMGLKVGTAKHPRPASFLTMSRIGAVEGVIRNSSKTFMKEMAKYYHNKPFSHQDVLLEINMPKINASILEPTILELHAIGDFEVIKTSGYINQVLTDNAFTHVEDLADGFHIKIWNRADVNLVKSGNLYNVPTGVSPIQEVIFKSVPGVNDPGQFLMTMIERFGSSGVRTITRHYHQDDTLDTLTVTSYAGADTSGTAVYKQALTYSNRGTKVWDYTLKREVYEASIDATGQYGPLVLIARDEEVYEDFSDTPAGGKKGERRMVKHTKGLGDQNLVTNYTYYSLGANVYIDGRLKSVERPDGSWEYYEYGDSPFTSSAFTKKYSSWKDVTLANYTEGKLVLTEVSKNEGTITTKIDGETIAQTKYKKIITGANQITMTTSRWTGTEWLETVQNYQSDTVTGVQAGKLNWVEHEDGTATTYSYSENNGEITLVRSTGAGNRNGITAGIKTTKVIKSFQVIQEEVRDIQTDAVLSSRVADLNYGVDSFGRPQKWIYNGNPNDYSIMQYGCCGLEYARNRSGATTNYYKDILKRTYRISRKSSSSDVAIDTTTAYNGLTKTVKRSDGTTVLLISETTRSLSGLTVTSKSPDANGDNTPETTTRVTTYPSAGGRSITTTYPDGTTTTSVTFIDRSTKSYTDQAGHTSTMDKGTHSLQGGGIYSLSTAANGTQTMKSYADHLGRGFRTEYADGSYSSQTYHGFTAAAGSRGKLATTTDPDENATAGTGSTISYTYNAEGQRTGTTTALSGGQSLVTTSDQDVVNDSTLGVSYRGRSWFNGVLTSTSLRSGDGYQSKSITLSGTSTSSRTVPVNGAWTVTSTSADGQQTVQTYINGQLQKTEMFDNQSTPVLIASTSYTYDALDRSLTTTDSRTGITTINGYLENGAATSITTNGGADTTSYTYDVMGRRTSTTLPDTSVTSTSYTSRGQTLATWGSQTYARLYQYDALGRMSELRTYQGLAHGTEPTTATTGYASTSWLYDTQRGWLTEKNYDGETDNGTADADYTYTASGRLKTRTWERGVVTTYGYDQGQLSTVVYTSDPANTPSVTYTYDNFGRPATVTQAGNTHTYAYDAANLVLDTETIAYDTDGNGTADFTRTLDRSQDTLLRPTGWTLKNGTTTEHSTAYTYDSASRLATVTGHSQTHTYGYTANSYGLVATVTSPVHTVTNTYEPSRNVLASKENSVPSVSSVVSNYTYTVNNIGQRTALTATGTAFATSNTLAWSYNAAGEVTAADHSDNTQDRSFEYDGIGNRKKSANSLTLPGADNYSINAWNQYTAITGQPVGRIHDADGNLTSGTLPVDQNGNATLVWDAENRLVAITRADNTVINYSYDYHSRRISKQIDTTPATYYIYDGWNMIADYTIQNSQVTLHHSYVWGMDLSGSMQGAGGVGGLLSVNEGSANYYSTYDGNGNISEYLDATGVAVAHYEYDTFGNTTVSSGTKAADFAHRFSTKPLDTETGLYYYGYRYYDPNVGRWLNRDPIEEQGGYNLYGFVDNDGLNYWDYLGLDTVENSCEVLTSDETDPGAKADALMDALVAVQEAIEQYERDLQWIRFKSSLRRLQIDIEWSIRGLPDWGDEELNRIHDWFQDFVSDGGELDKKPKTPPNIKLPPSARPRLKPILPGAKPKPGIRTVGDVVTDVAGQKISPKSPLGAWDVYNYIKLYKSFSAVKICLKARSEERECYDRLGVGHDYCERLRKRADAICRNKADVTDVISRLP